MHTLVFDDVKNLSMCIAIVSGGVLITAFLDSVVKRCILKGAKCTCPSCYAHGDEWSRRIWQTFHAVFHVMHMLILFFSTWYAVRYILSEDSATKIFAGVAVGLGFAMQDVVKAVIAFFRITLSGEIVEGCSLEIGDKPYGTVKDISIFHVALESDKSNVTYFSTSKLLNATYTVGNRGSGCSTTIKPGLTIDLFNRRLVR